jgi:hypothetical protein
VVKSVCLLFEAVITRLLTRYGKRNVYERNPVDYTRD